MEKKQVVATFNVFGRIALRPDKWIISLVRHKERAPDHCFLLLESLTDKGERIIKKVHLVQKKLKNGTRDLTQAEIECKDIKYQDELSEDCRSCVYRSWMNISHEQKAKLDEKIAADQALSEADRLFYVKVGYQSTGGFSAATFKFGGLDSLTDWIIQQNNLLVAEPSRRYQSPLFFHNFTDSSLRKGHNCVSWAVDSVQKICPEEKVGTILSGTVVNIAQDVLPSDPKRCCNRCVIV